MFNGISVFAVFGVSGVAGGGPVGSVGLLGVFIFLLDLTDFPSPDLFFLLLIILKMSSAVFSAVLAIRQASKTFLSRVASALAITSLTLKLVY